MLLEAGADSNNIGDRQGIRMNAKTSVLAPYQFLHRLCPLYILRHLKARPHAKGDLRATMDIERLLLDHNALI
jgi:hypothetical protein